MGAAARASSGDTAAPFNEKEKISISEHALAGQSRFEHLARRDERSLTSLGKKQVLKRRFGVISTLGLTTTLMLTWEGVLVYFGFGLANGGSAGLITSYILSWAGFLAIMVPLAELVSMAPTSSGQYHWAYMLAPQSSRKLLSYITGWLSVAVWQSIVAMGGVLMATLTQDLITLNHRDTYTATGWQGTLLIWTAVLVSLVFNSLLGRWLPKIEGLILYLHILGFFALIIPLLYLADRASAKEVFTTWDNQGGWPSTGLAFFVGIVTNLGPFIGADGAIHLAEETHNAAMVIPWNIVITVLFNGILGFGMLLVSLFCMSNIEAAFSSPFHYPFIEIFVTSSGSVAGTTVMTSIVNILACCATFGQFATASRQLWAFARDRGPPMSKWLVRISPDSYLPMNAIYATCGISLLLALINIGSTEALQSILSFTTSSWMAAASIPMGLLFYNRVTGKIRPHVFNDDHFATAAEGRLTWGPWRVPEPYGSIVNAIGLCWITISFFFSLWPTEMNPSPASMNWSVLMTGFWFIFGIVYYFCIGNKYYKGPIVETR